MMHYAALLAVFAVCRADEEETAPEEYKTIGAAEALSALNAMVAANFQVTTAAGVKLTVEAATTATVAGGKVEIRAQFSGTIDQVDVQAENAARTEIARRLEIDVSRISVTGKLPGSFIIIFLIDNGVAAVILPRQGGDDGLSDGAIAGIVVGTVVGAGLITFLIVWFCCCQEEDEKKEEDPETKTQTATTEHAPYGEGKDNKGDEMKQPSAVDTAVQDDEV